MAEREPTPPTGSAHQIVIVGGGAGGLELATRLGDTLGRRGQVAVTLVDRARTHVWKPKLHEIAAGSMNMDAHELDYLAQAHWHHFQYRTGEMTGLDRARRQIHLAPYIDDEGRQVIEVLARNGLKQGENGLKIIMMCEVPSNALLADEFHRSRSLETVDLG